MVVGDRIGARLLDVGARVHQLHGAGLVAQHDELHLLLVAHRLDPAGDGHGSVGRGGEVLDEGAVGHGASLVGRACAESGHDLDPALQEARFVVALRRIQDVTSSLLLLALQERQAGTTSRRCTAAARDGRTQSFCNARPGAAVRAAATRADRGHCWGVRSLSAAAPDPASARGAGASTPLTARAHASRIRTRRRGARRRGRRRHRPSAAPTRRRLQRLSSSRLGEAVAHLHGVVGITSRSTRPAVSSSLSALGEHPVARVRRRRRRSR